MDKHTIQDDKRKFARLPKGNKLIKMQTGIHGAKNAIKQFVKTLPI